MKLKKISTYSLIGLTLFSCKNEDSIVPVDDEKMKSNYEIECQLVENGQEFFARILSKAVANSKELRGFIKNEAIKKFDMDYDLLYHKTRNKEVIDGLTFRDIILANIITEEEKAQFLQIENNLPLLTIYIPNLLNITGFSADSWDISNEQIAVAYELDKNTNVYENGEIVGFIEKGMIPDFPILYIKENTKLSVNNKIETRSNEFHFSYNFIKPEYDGTNKIQTRKSNGPVEVDLSEFKSYIEDGLDKKYIDDAVINAFNENIKASKNQKAQNFTQRDYIYYGITADKNEGIYNEDIMETILRFKVSPKAFVKISDDIKSNNLDNGDPFLQEVKKYKGSDYSYNEIVQRIWGGGVFDFNFTFFIPEKVLDKDGNLKERASQEATRKSILVQPSELFAIKRYNRNKRDKKAFKSRRFIYKVTNPLEDLEALWYYPTINSTNVPMTRSRGYHAQQNVPSIDIINGWDLRSVATNMHILVTESDAKEVQKLSKDIKSSYSKTLNGEVFGDVNLGSKGGKGKIGGKIGYGTTNVYEVITSISYQYETGDDDLGEEDYYYRTPIIKQIKDNKVYLNSINMGGINICIVPQYKGIVK